LKNTNSTPVYCHKDDPDPPNNEPPTTSTFSQRFECIDLDHNCNKFYELTDEMLLFGPTVTRRWGRIGSRRPRSLSKDYETWEKAKRESTAILRRRDSMEYNKGPFRSSSFSKNYGPLAYALGASLLGWIENSSATMADSQ
jgi:predicted DNA-binding WGR domain protein